MSIASVSVPWRAVVARRRRARVIGWALRAFAASVAGCSPGNDGAPAAPSPTDASIDDAGGVVDAAEPCANCGTDGDGAAPVPGPDGGALTGDWVAFVSNRNGDFDIFAVRPDGTDLHTIVQGPGNQLFPSWSPDGATIAYASDATGTYALFLAEAATGRARELLNDRPRGTSPAFSPDGLTIAFGGDGPGGGLIYTVPVTGGHATALTAGTARDGSPVWAPDGRALYFSSDRAGPFEIWSVALDGSALTRVTTGSNLVGGPAISPDGRTLAFTRTQAATADGGVAELRLAFYTLASGTMTLSEGSDSEPAFAAHGDRIGVTSTRFGASNPEIVIMGADASTPFRLTRDPGVDSEVAFKPSP